MANESTPVPPASKDKGHRDISQTISVDQDVWTLSELFNTRGYKKKLDASNTAEIRAAQKLMAEAATNCSDPSVKTVTATLNETVKHDVTQNDGAMYTIGSETLHSTFMTQKVEYVCHEGKPEVKGGTIKDSNWSSAYDASGFQTTMDMQEPGKKYIQQPGQQSKPPSGPKVK
jgi:hypothetical protein